MRCRRAESTLTLLAEGVEVEPGDATRHIARCLRCQAELAQHRRVRRTMRSLAGRTEEPAPSLLADILSELDGGDRPDVAAAGAGRARRILVVAGATVLTAAGATGAVVWTTRSRRVPAG